MPNEYKQCPNGHYYQGAQCPYCKPGRNAGSSTSAETELYGPGGSQAPTEPMPGFENGTGGSTKTTVLDGSHINQPNPSTRTVFGDEEDTDITGDGSNGQPKGYRTARKLVGWLVSYTLDALGVDFKLYEGRNIIGRNAECNISVNDNMVSGEHAVILYRAGKYSITDRQSSHGTFVNGNDIELEPCYLQDGDEIRMGKTQFKFRTSF